MPVIDNISLKEINFRTRKQIPNINRYFYIKSILKREAYKRKEKSSIVRDI